MWRRKWQPTPVHFPGKNPRMEEPDRLPRVGHDWATSLYFTLLSHIQHIHQKAKVKNLDVLSRFGCVQLFVTLMGCNPPGSSVRGILQARILEWVAISFSVGPSRPGDWNCISRVSFTAGVFFTTEPCEAAGAGSGTPLQCSCLESPMDGGAWEAAVHVVVKSWTQLSDFTFPFHFHALEKEMATHSSVLAWRIPGMGEPGGLPLWGCTESDTTEAT